jgi:spore coat protein H
MCLVGFAQAQNLSLSGKVVDAEEGNGLNAVTVSMVKADLKATTAKNGTWSLLGTIGTGVGNRRMRTSEAESFLHVEAGRLLLRMGGKDLLGRRMPDGIVPPSNALAARSLGEALDTLVYSRDGYAQKRVPLTSASIVGLLDSIRRVRYPGWVDSSHSNGFKPDTTDAFPDTLRKVTLRVSAANWDRMTKAMSDLCGAYGTPTKCQVGELDFIDNAALIWIPADLEADGKVWKNVGIRMKGNGSLRDAWSRKLATLPFRISMDKFEDSIPTTKNQRFHGFKKLSLYNSSQDGSDIREAVAGEIFRAANLPVAMSVPIRFQLIHGNVTQDLGPYSMVEVPDNPLLNRVFGNDSGNLYKPHSALDTFRQAEFFDDDLETDYADVKALIKAINDPIRISSPAAWRTQLEKSIDMRGWVKWLALSHAIGHWDAYGVAPHNYYLFNDRGVLRWITYDMGWSLVDLTDELIWYDLPGGGDFYPLAEYAMNDPVYCKEYRTHIEEAISDRGAFSAPSFKARVERYGKMVSSMPSTLAEVNKLKTYAERRHAAIRTALADPRCR